MGRAAMGRAIRQSIVATRMLHSRGDKAGLGLSAGAGQMMSQMESVGGPPLVRTARGSEVQVGPEDQFRLSLEAQQLGDGGQLNAQGLPLPKFEPPLEKSMPPLQTELKAGQQSAVEAAVLERTKQLNRLFEDQVKKQYDAMRREVAKLGKAHQKDVQALDQRFKAKMAGLATKFKQLEAEEARMEVIKQENADLQQTVAQMQQMMEDQDERNKASLATIAEREAMIGQLSNQLTEITEGAERMKQEMLEKEKAANLAKSQMDETIAQMARMIEKKKGDLKTMQSRLVNAKSSFDQEVIRKQAEVSELEASMKQLNNYTSKMSEYTKQVQSQIMTREQDMKTQLALMKNTIAFALYIDETLQVDLTDPYTTTLLVKPVEVYPSGVTYSQGTLEKLQSEAKRKGVPCVCPQSGEEITHWAPNLVVESILARYLFKQQITKDVMHSLQEFQTKTPMGEEDQPLEKYLQRMKASMVERLEGEHQEAIAKTTNSYQQQLEVKTAECDANGKERDSLKAELAQMRDEYNAFKKQSLLDATGFDDQLEDLRGQLRASQEEVASLKEKRTELVNRATKLTARLTKLEEGLEDDADGLDDPTSNRELQRVRKSELLALRAQLNEKDTELEEWKARVEERDAEILKLRELLEQLQRELAGEQRVSAGLVEERDALQAKVKALQQEAAASQADLQKTKASLADTVTAKGASDESAKSFSYKFTEANLKLEQLVKDSEKLRARLAAKEELAKNTSADNAALAARSEELLAESGRKDRALASARQQALEEKQKGLEFEQACSWLREDKTRLEQTVERKSKEASTLMDRATKAEATAKMLQARLDAMGAKSSEASLEMRDLQSVQKQAGVFDPLSQLPNVPVLEELTATIRSAENSLTEFTKEGGTLKQMAQVEVLNVDQTIPPDEGEFRALGDPTANEIPLPYPPVLMRQFTPPPENLRPPSPPSPLPGEAPAAPAAAAAAAEKQDEGSGAPAPSSAQVQSSGAGSLVLPEQN